MTKRTSLLSNVLFWSLVSAAFIGPGTVTTAAKAGANFGLTLLWALLFSTLATILLQEASARITIASGKNLGKILSLKYQGSNSENIKLIIFFAVAFGCAAYQTGNLIGAVSGVGLLTAFSPKLITLGIAAVCAIILWMGNIQWMAKSLGIIVALMGVFFVYIAFQSEVQFYNLLESALLPTTPAGSTLLIISLIGTTIVPYNLFLASGISKGQSIKEMRIGIALAVLIGGFISMTILVVGTLVTGEFSFQNLAAALYRKTNEWSTYFFAFGLCAAGLSSAVTAPLAAAITAQSLFQKEGQEEDWSVKSTAFRLVSIGVLIVGLLFSLLDIQPIPAIILAQAINGMLLPVVTIFLLLAINDSSLLPDGYTNSTLANLFMLLIVGVTCFLGSYNILKAISRAVNVEFSNVFSFTLCSIISGLTLLLLAWKVFVSNK
ncbi:MAG: divalent metal cation transporter [Bacteroidota bacterium]